MDKLFRYQEKMIENLVHMALRHTLMFKSWGYISGQTVQHQTGHPHSPFKSPSPWSSPVLPQSCWQVYTPGQPNHCIGTFPGIGKCICNQFLQESLALLLQGPDIISHVTLVYDDGAIPEQSECGQHRASTPTCFWSGSPPSAAGGTCPTVSVCWDGLGSCIWSLMNIIK